MVALSGLKAISLTNGLMNALVSVSLIFLRKAFICLCLSYVMTHST